MEDVPAVETQSEITPVEESRVQAVSNLHLATPSTVPNPHQDCEMADEPVPAEGSTDSPVFSNIAPPVDFVPDVASAAAEEVSYEKEHTKIPKDIMDDFEGHQRKAEKQAAKIEITEREFLTLCPLNDSETTDHRVKWAAEVFVELKTEADWWTKQHGHLGINNRQLKYVARIVEDMAAACAEENLPEGEEQDEVGKWIKKWKETESTDLEVYEREVELIREDIRRDRLAFFKKAVRKYLKMDVFVEDDAAVNEARDLVTVDRNSPPHPERLQEKGTDFHPSCKRNASQLFGGDEHAVSKSGRPIKTARGPRRK